VLKHSTFPVLTRSVAVAEIADRTCCTTYTVATNRSLEQPWSARWVWLLPTRKFFGRGVRGNRL